MTGPEAHSVLKRWPVDVQSCELAAERENIVFCVRDIDGYAYALRFHRDGYRSADEIESELQWMAELENSELAVPRPVASYAGQYIETVNGRLVSLLTWLSGQPLGKASTPLQIEDRAGTFYRFGAALAKMHAISDSWPQPLGFTRPTWDIDGLTGSRPYWGPYWENPALNNADRQIILAARDKARDELLSNTANLDYGLIHADLVRENVLIEGVRIKFIDFDDCGTGFRLFDIATALLKNMQEPDYTILETALLSGYRSIRAVQSELLPIFLLLRAFTYLGWIIPRLHENGAKDRNERNLVAAIGLARSYLR